MRQRGRERGLAGAPDVAHRGFAAHAGVGVRPRDLEQRVGRLLERALRERADEAPAQVAAAFVLDERDDAFESLRAAMGRESRGGLPAQVPSVVAVLLSRSSTGIADGS